MCKIPLMPENTPLILLVVDDHAGFRRTVRQMFDGRAVVVLEAASGEEAVECFVAKHPDWIIMDLRMPGMGGIKATEAILKLNPRARIIVISQFTDIEFRQQALRAGALHFLDKEHISQLLEIVGPNGL